MVSMSRFFSLALGLGLVAGGLEGPGWTKDDRRFIRVLFRDVGEVGILGL